ncbi:hypothetical protein AK812_SmicGene31934 [Symbiodinium microadriaticum]|uniref:RRM domain-containing protein n=2 Tax=Symbiodinium microadriaticum TaxID=2951 RepID=A0A1Q9CVK1_SYMMI|nr:hypothetical protein AK812_SmicGene31934 [Symbiodinium microadriaticum]
MASHRRQHRAAATEWDNAEGIFLRNIPAKCDERILRTFLESQGLVDFEMEMALFPNGKSRGFATIIFRDRSGIQDFVRNVHGQFVPGFHKPTALRCEPLRSHEQQSQPARPSQTAASRLGDWPTAPLQPAGYEGPLSVPKSGLTAGKGESQKATGKTSKASSGTAQSAGAAGVRVVAKSTPVEPGYSSQERSVRGIPPIAVVQNSDGTISFRL